MRYTINLYFNKKIIKIFFWLIIAFKLFSCKESKDSFKQKDQEPIMKEVTVDSAFFELSITLRSDTTDRFQFVFANPIENEKIERVKVDASNDYVTITGKINAYYLDDLPNVAYLGLGYFYPKTVGIKEVKVQYKNKEHVFLPQDFEEYFTINEYIERLEDSGKYRTVRINNKLVPIFALKKEAIDIIK